MLAGLERKGCPVDRRAAVYDVGRQGLLPPLGHEAGGQIEPDADTEGAGALVGGSSCQDDRPSADHSRSTGSNVQAQLGAGRDGGGLRLLLSPHGPKEQAAPAQQVVVGRERSYHWQAGGQKPTHVVIRSMIDRTAGLGLGWYNQIRDGRDVRAWDSRQQHWMEPCWPVQGVA